MILSIFFCFQDKVFRAMSAFKELLQETKKITDKSLSLVKDQESGHMAEIIELLSKVSAKFRFQKHT